jgi:predicted ATPase
MTINNIWNYSNPDIVFKKAKVYLGNNASIKLSDKPEKKYMIYNPIKNKWIYFGQMGYEDFTKHHDQLRRQRYLKRTENMRGDWRDDPYSPNNLSRNILW